MATHEKVTLMTLQINDTAAVKSIAELRDNIAKLKEAINNADEGVPFERVQEATKQLREQQAALKNAMYAQGTTWKEVTAAAQGTGKSYNALVAQMADLKTQLRAVDVSTESGAARFKELATEINGINDQLKDMDALQGNFQRNVGNYAGGIKKAFADMATKAGDSADALRKGLGAATGGLGGFKDGMEGIAKSPAVASIGILLSVVMKLADSLKDNETAMDAMKKAGASLKPIMDFLGNIIEKLAEVLADVIGKVTEFVTSNGVIDKVIKGVMGVGNAILQYVISPFKGIVAAIKVFREQGVKGIGDAARAFGQEMKSGISFKQNFQAGQTAAETMMAGAKSKKEEVKAAGKEIGTDMKDGVLEGLENLAEEIDKQMEADLAAVDKAMTEAQTRAKDSEKRRLDELAKAYANRADVAGILIDDENERAAKTYAIEEEGNKKRLALLEQFAADALERSDMDAYLAYQQEAADLEVEIWKNAKEEEKRQSELAEQQETERWQKRIEMMEWAAGATSSILGSLADMMETDGKESAKNAKKAKALRIASATIDTLTGAVSALATAARDPGGIPGMIIGAANAATITAAGVANIAKIRATDATGGSSAGVTTSAPAPVLSVPEVRTITTASDESRLNNLIADQRVYIYESDIEASLNDHRVRVSESSF